MPEIANILVRKSVGSVDSARPCCAACKRTPLVGERLHEMEGGRRLCELCLISLPEEDRRAVRSERIHATERQLAVGPHAA